jgi:pantothenate synthetase
MGAWHSGHVASFTPLAAGLRRRREHFDNPAQFNVRPTWPATRATRPRCRRGRRRQVDVLFVPTPDEIYPPDFASWVDVNGEARGFGALSLGTSAGNRLPEALSSSIRYRVLWSKDAQQVAVIEQLVRISICRSGATVPTVAMSTAWRCRRETSSRG